MGSVLWVFPCPPACRGEENWGHEAETPVFLAKRECLTEQSGCEPFHVADLCPTVTKVPLCSDAPLDLAGVTRDVTALFTYCQHVACQGGAGKSQETLVRGRKGRGQVSHVHWRWHRWGSCSWADVFLAWFFSVLHVVFPRVMGWEFFPLPCPFSGIAISHMKKVLL